MGTRHLIAVVIDGDFKIAQYGQWDGYPDGQGKTVLEFCQRFEIADFKERFLTKLRACTWLTPERGAKIDKVKDWSKVYPHLSRDAGGKILEMVANSLQPLELQDRRTFAGDSLFCEWGYVIDFDKGVFEAYRGFNKVPTPADSRFPSGADWLEKDDDPRKDDGGPYQPIVLAKSYPLDALPSLETFLADLADPEEEAAAA